MWTCAWILSTAVLFLFSLVVATWLVPEVDHAGEDGSPRSAPGADGRSLPP